MNVRPAEGEPGPLEKGLAKTYPLVQTGLGIAGAVAAFGTPASIGFMGVAAVSLWGFIKGLRGARKARPVRRADEPRRAPPISVSSITTPERETP